MCDFFTMRPFKDYNKAASLLEYTADTTIPKIDFLIRTDCFYDLKKAAPPGAAFLFAPNKKALPLIRSTINSGRSSVKFPPRPFFMQRF